MDKRRVLLLCKPSLLSEGLTHLLKQVVDVEVVGPWTAAEWSLTRHAETAPHVVLVAEPDDNCNDEWLITSHILEHYADLPVIRISVAATEMRVHAARSLPAHNDNLISLIQQGWQSYQAAPVAGADRGHDRRATDRQPT